MLAYALVLKQLIGIDHEAQLVTTNGSASILIDKEN